MKRKNWTRGMIVLGITLLAAAVALMPACESGDNIDACESLPGNWDITFSLESGEDCGQLDGKTLPATISVISSEEETLMVLTIPEPYDLTAEGLVTCDQENFDYTGLAVAYPEPGCQTLLSFPDALFESETEFTAEGTVTISSYALDGCIPCSGLFSISAVKD